MTPGQRAALRCDDPVPRWWFSRPEATLLSRWWPVQWGSDEWARLTVALRVPFGYLVIATRRLPGFSGPCARCGQWELDEQWEFPHCAACQREIDDYCRGCRCPSLLEPGGADKPWPSPDCSVHAS